MKPLALQPNLVEQVKDAIFEAVLAGRFQPSERVIQEQIAQNLGVSRQPVQQALLLLRNQGVLVDAPGRGLMVPVLDLSHVVHVYEIRAQLEALACQRAVERLSDVDIQSGDNLLEQGRSAIESGTVPRMIAADIAFHEFLYRASGNPLIATTMAPHLVYTQRVMGEVLLKDQEPRDIWGQHEAIWQAIRRRDAAQAQNLVQSHLLNACNYMVQRLQGS